MSIDEIRKM